MYKYPSKTQQPTTNKQGNSALDELGLVGPRGGINETSNQPNAGFILFDHERGPIFYSSCCMAHVIYSGPFGVMKFIQRLNIPPVLQAPPESQWTTVHRLGAYQSMPGIIDQLRQSSSTQCCPPHEVLSSQWWVNLIERYLTMSHWSSHIFTSSGLLELIEGSFPSISGARNTSKRSYDGYD